MFLDWVRILAFAVLVLYHVGMVYVSWDWHVKSPRASTGLEPWMRLSSPWRMDLLFLVSGAATSFMLLRDGATRPLLAQRAWRILLPLLFGMLVVVPPQSWLEVVHKLGYAGSYIDFMRLYLTAYGGFCFAPGRCLVLPTWNHLWFLPYLFVYTLLLWAVLRRRPALLDRMAAVLPGWLTGPALLALPVLFLVTTRLLLARRFPVTHALVDDWFAHSQFLAMFLLGAVLARAPSLWLRMARYRWPALGLAVAGWALLVSSPPVVLFAGGEITTLWSRSLFYSVQQWCAIVAALGFARLHLNRDNALRRYLTDAVLPLYILHQTVIVLLAPALARWQLPLVPEGAVLVLATFALCLLGYECARRVRWLRPLFGLRAGGAVGAARHNAADVTTATDRGGRHGRAGGGAGVRPRGLERDAVRTRD